MSKKNPTVSTAKVGSLVLFCGLIMASQASFAVKKASCLQDQYGNQYNVVYDTTTDSITGTMTTAQGCPATTWPLIGSYRGKVMEITAANPDLSSCVNMYMLKGSYPNFAWFYANGYGAQESAYVACGAPASADGSSGGAQGAK